MIDLFGNEIVENVGLKELYVVPPFTILDAKTGDWQKRKNKWKSLGIKSELGRDATTYNMKDWLDKKHDEGKLKGNEGISDTSIFDPTLCEIMYKWFCPDNGSIIDPFAGGSVRGIVANYLGYKYTGVDLRQEQIDSNKEQGINILQSNNQPNWICGDSNQILDNIPNNYYDMAFSCPPYFDLEVYSNDKNDLSNMTWDGFKDAYKSIIRKMCNKLKKGALAVFVVGEVRGNGGGILV